ncbi:lipoprotein [Mycoplasmopsis californica]|uniref:Lipoprotein n=1 Tax=Mycoplasmopsis californica TaxID=2113 RepID=A0A059XLB1_9BACT|nr:hypothetical protein [Mycoplasmopsis californica]AIA29279.1 lipoprotein [Mycoplasmopsis californica]
MKLKLPLFSFLVVVPSNMVSSCIKEEHNILTEGIDWNNIDLKVTVKNKKNIYVDDLKDKDILIELNSDAVKVKKILIISKQDDSAKILIRLVSKNNFSEEHEKIFLIEGFKVKNKDTIDDTNLPLNKDGDSKQDEKLKPQINLDKDKTSPIKMSDKKVIHPKPNNNNSDTNDPTNKNLNSALPNNSQNPDSQINSNTKNEQIAKPLGSQSEDDSKLNNMNAKPKKEEIINPSKPNINSDEESKQNILSRIADKHFLEIELMQKFSSNEIFKMTKSYNEALLGINNFLKTGNYGNSIDFTGSFDKSQTDKFWSFTNKIGVYGDYGQTTHEKVEFYNRSLSIDGMVKQVYLDKFDENDKLNAKVIDKSEFINKLVSKNPFGFLPSNLSQFFYYASLQSISKNLDIKNIKYIKANFDDEVGSIAILIENINGEKFLIEADKQKVNNLKMNDDFYNYIYDRSFMFSWYAKGWERNFFEKDKGIQNVNENGTMWVVDRVINPEVEKQGFYEFLVATNIHVFSLRKIFDKSLYFDIDSNNEKSKQWNGGFSFSDLNQQVTPRQGGFFFGTRGYQTRSLKGNNFVNSESGSYFPIAKAYEQYLISPYYTPRYYADGFWDIDAETGKKHLEVYDQSTRIGGTKNAGADFVILRLKIHKDNLKHILPKLDEILKYYPEKEKDWYIGLGKNELFHPIKTQFYGGYPVNVDEYFNPDFSQGLASFSFKYNKSTGGIINTQNRIVNKDVFQSLWVKYDENENKDWNSHNDNYKKYLKPFIKDEHGMSKTILTQHSQLYTYAPYEQRKNILGPGSSGSMVIDSSFNLIGINYLFTKDVTYTDTYSNAVALMQGHGEYKNGFDGNLRTDFVKKLINDKVQTVKLNPVKAN